MKYFKKKNFQKEPRVTFTRYHTSAVSVIVGETKENSHSLDLRQVSSTFARAKHTLRKQGRRRRRRRRRHAGFIPFRPFCTFLGEHRSWRGRMNGEGWKEEDTEERNRKRERESWSKGRKFARRLFSGSPNLKNGILPLCGESRREVRISLRAATRGKRGGEAWWRDGRVINEYSQ